MGQIIFDLITVGILIPQFDLRKKTKGTSYQTYIRDSYVTGDFILDKKIKLKLKEATFGLGSFLELKRSLVLDRLRDKIQICFDDRFVRLEKLLEPSFKLWEIFNSSSLECLTHKDEDLLFSKLFEQCVFGTEEIDISNSKFSTEASLPIETCDYLFRICQDGKIVVDNLLVNQEGKLSHRFNYLPGFFKPTKKFNENEVIEAEVLLSESLNVHCIYTGTSTLDTHIVLDGLGKRRCADLELYEIFIGIDKNELILVDQKGKRILPKFYTAVSYSKLSHPIAKILWHFSEVGQPKLSFYQNSSFLKMPYTPRLVYKNLILLPKKWYFEDIKIDDINELRGFLKEHQLPEKFLFGDSDAELFINSSQEGDLLVLLDELKGVQNFFIYENLDTSIRRSNGKVCYPQFHYCHQTSHKTEYNRIRFLNKLSKPNESWLAFCLCVHEVFVESVLHGILGLMGPIQQRIKWFYIIYGSGQVEIRLRFYVGLSDSKKREVLKLMSEVMLIEGVTSVKHKLYYPEYEKYGKKGLVKSESIFYLESEYIRKMRLFKKFEMWDCVVLISDLWSKIFIKKGERDYVSYYKGIYSNYDLNTKKYLQKGYQECRNRDVELDGGETLFEAVYKVLESHENDAEIDPLFIFLNHIHMYCNRLLLGSDEERAVFYFIYRILLSRNVSNSVLYETPIVSSTPSSRNIFS